MKYYFYPPGHNFHKVISENFEYSGNTTGSRVWEFIGTKEEFEKKLSGLNLYVKDWGFNSKPEWNDGEWQMVFLESLPQ